MLGLGWHIVQLLDILSVIIGWLAALEVAFLDTSYWVINMDWISSMNVIHTRGKQGEFNCDFFVVSSANNHLHQVQQEVVTSCGVVVPVIATWAQ